MEAKILVVDDNKKNVQLLAIILKENGYNVEFALSGNEALEWLKVESFDLVLLDIMMPEMDGYEVCSRIKKQSSLVELPIIFITAISDSESITKGFQKGGVDYITKPFNPEELLARVETHVMLKQARDEMRAKNDELGKVISARDRLFSIIAHDLKNSFFILQILSNEIISNFDTLKMDELEGHIRSMKHQSEEGQDLLDKLLEWAKIQTGKIKVKPEKLDINSIAESVKRLLLTTAQNKKVQILIDSQSNGTAFADEVMVETVIRNLVSNALKYTSENNNVTIKIMDFKDQIKVAVADKGTGIRMEHQKNLLGLNNDYVRKGTNGEGGSGLGLILCKEFVTKNQGEIWFESEFGKGTTFFFTLSKNSTSIN